MLFFLKGPRPRPFKGVCCHHSEHVRDHRAVRATAREREQSRLEISADTSAWSYVLILGRLLLQASKHHTVASVDLNRVQIAVRARSKNSEHPAVCSKCCQSGPCTPLFTHLPPLLRLEHDSWDGIEAVAHCACACQGVIIGKARARLCQWDRNQAAVATSVKSVRRFGASWAERSPRAHEASRGGAPL